MTDRAQQAVDLLVEQYKCTKTVPATVRAVADEMNVADDAIISLLSIYSIDDAAGVNLDVIGKVVGQPRPFVDEVDGENFAFEGGIGLGFDEGRFAGTDADFTQLATDDVYRRIIRARIIVNNGDATIEDIAEFMRFAFEVNVNISTAVGAIAIAPDRPLSPSEARLLSDLFPRAGGVRVYSTSSNVTAAGDRAFSFSGNPTGLGFA